MRVNLVLLSTAAMPSLPVWALGQVYAAVPEPKALMELVARQLPLDDAEAWLFWDNRLALPAVEKIMEVMNRPGQVWHAGLSLGMRGQPAAIDFVAPTWMLNCDPPADIEATSWRVSLRACLVLADVLKTMGFLRPGFQSLDAAALEWGHRCIRRGVALRHLPDLLDTNSSADLPAPVILMEDQLRFVHWRFGRKWLGWAAVRAALSGAGWREVNRAVSAVSREKPAPDPAPYMATSGAEEELRAIASGRLTGRVSVLVPTLERYSYLKTLLGQLQTQTHPPVEVIVVDQTPLPQRPENFYAEFTNLPLQVIYLDQAGQCISRNAGLQAAGGNFILFLDDDDEIPADLIENHLNHLMVHRVSVSAGIAHEVGAGDLPEDFKYPRVSDVFPTNNAMMVRSALQGSGLFDLAYDRGQRADGDLGLRLYLSGIQMRLNPAIAVLHHHAPRGGLRAHKARVVTYASSRARITHRHIPSVSDLYLQSRYFSKRQIREANWLAVFGTFVGNGNAAQKILKGIFAALVLPHTLWSLHTRRQKSLEMMKTFPRIPALDPNRK